MGKKLRNIKFVGWVLTQHFSLQFYYHYFQRSYKIPIHFFLIHTTTKAT
jgi:hypothetical protein